MVQVQADLLLSGRMQYRFGSAYRCQFQARGISIYKATSIYSLLDEYVKPRQKLTYNILV
jgi:hypothetical protein